MAALIQSAVSPVIASLSNTSLKPLRPNNKTLLGVCATTSFKPFCPSNENPTLSFSISRLQTLLTIFASHAAANPISLFPFARSNASQIKSKSPKRSCRLLAACGLVDGISDGYPGSESSDLEADATIDIKLPRRSLLVQFTCDKCGVRTDRLINQLAYERGLVYVQCAGCEQYHKLADNLGLVVEYDLREEINAKPSTDEAFDQRELSI